MRNDKILRKVRKGFRKEREAVFSTFFAFLLTLQLCVKPGISKPIIGTKEGSEF
jgi:hypothetical protein